MPCYTKRFGFRFFFSSRRRHTRSLRDWSSDVCSSDLGNATVEGAEPTRYRPDWGGLAGAAPSLSATFVSAAAAGAPQVGRGGRPVIAVRRSEERRGGKGCSPRGQAAHRRHNDVSGTKM